MLEIRFVNVPVGGGVTTNVKFVTWPLVNVIPVQSTTPLPFVPPPVALTNVNPDGNVSVTMIPLAVEGPKFVMLIV